MSISLSRLVCGMAFVALLGACSSTPTAVTDHNPNFDFSGVQRIAILPLNRNVTPQTAVSDMQEGRMAQSLADAMAGRGLDTTTDLQQADMLLTWHLVTQERTDIRTYNTMSARYTRCWSCPTTSSQNVRVTQFTQGTMIVDLLDPASGSSVWRSIFETRLRSNLSDEDRAELRNTAAQALFAEFPP